MKQNGLDRTGPDPTDGQGRKWVTALLPMCGSRHFDICTYTPVSRLTLALQMNKSYEMNRTHDCLQTQPVETGLVNPNDCIWRHHIHKPWITIWNTTRIAFSRSRTSQAWNDWMTEWVHMRSPWYTQVITVGSVSTAWALQSRFVDKLGCSIYDIMKACH